MAHATTTEVITDPTEIRLRALVREIHDAARERHRGHQCAYRHRAGMHEASVMLRLALDDLYGRPRDRRAALSDVIESIPA